MSAKAGLQKSLPEVSTRRRADAKTSLLKPDTARAPFIAPDSGRSHRAASKPSGGATSLDQQSGRLPGRDKPGHPETPVKNVLPLEGAKTDELSSSAVSSPDPKTPKQPQAGSADEPKPSGDSRSAEPARPRGANDPVGVKLPELPKPVPEAVAEIQSVDLAGASDRSLVAFTNASPSQMGRSFPQLAPAVGGKLGEEKRQAAADVPELEVKLSGKVDAKITSVADIGVSEGKSPDAPPASTNADQQAAAHHNRGGPPANEAELRVLDEPPTGSFLDWLREKITRIVGRIKVTDEGINTEAGDRPGVRLDHEANPERLTKEGDQAQGQVVQRRDRVAETMRSHPGQENIQAVERQETHKPRLNVDPEVMPEAPGAGSAMSEFASVPLPEDVRGKADELMAPSLAPGLQKARTQTVEAATQRDRGKQAAVDDARSQARAINDQSNLEQRNIVIEQRRKVATQQTQGIREANAAVEDLRGETRNRRSAARREIGEHVKNAEGQAKAKIEDGEREARAKKLEGERKAQEKKRELERAKKKQSWWDRAKSAIKSAVKSLTKAIGKIFDEVRALVKKAIDAAKKAAIGLINRARRWVVDKLERFRSWAKTQVDKYLKDRFPALAKRINGAIDGFVDTAKAGVNRLADAAVAAVERLASALSAALDKILSTFSKVIQAGIGIAGALMTGDIVGALKIAVQAACDIAGIDSKVVFGFFERAAANLLRILRHPLRFAQGLVSAVGGGMRSFFKNIRKHLVDGVIGWLTGALSEVQLTIPRPFDPRGAFSLAAQILGLTYDNVEARFLRKYPQAAGALARIKQVFAFLPRLQKEGPVALWGELKEAAVGLKERVLGKVRNYVVVTVATEAAKTLVAMLTPVGAIAKAVKMVFDFAMWLRSRWDQIKSFVTAVYNTMADLASGNFAKVVQGVEGAMARSLPVLISLLARLAGLGGIGKTVQKIIQTVSRPINKVIDKLIDKMGEFAKKVWRGAKAGAKKIASAISSWWKVRVPFKTRGGASHTLLFKGRGTSARVAVRSEEQLYESFLTKLDASGLDDRKKKLAGDARKKLAAIDKEKAKPIQGTTPKAKAEAEKVKRARMEKLLGQLREATAELMDLPVPVRKPVAYGGMKSSGFAASMSAPALSMADLGKGSGPTTAPHKVYDALNQRRQSGGASFYIRGHLLNDQLGGPGEWYNMTPLSRSGNAKHHNEVEKQAKAAVRAGRIVEYSVVPSYKRKVPGGLLGSVVEGRAKEEKEILTGIVEAEQHVPTKLVVEMAHTDVRTGAKVSRKIPDIENPVPQDSAAYFIGPGHKVEPIRINSVTSASALELAGFGKKESERIVVAVAAAIRKGEPYTSYADLARDARIDVGELQTKSKNRRINLGT